MRVSMEKPMRADRTKISIDSKRPNYEVCNLFSPPSQLQLVNENRIENDHESKTKRIIDSNSSRFGVF